MDRDKCRRLRRLNGTNKFVCRRALNDISDNADFKKLPQVARSSCTVRARICSWGKHAELLGDFVPLRPGIEISSTAMSGLSSIASLRASARHAPRRQAPNCRRCMTSALRRQEQSDGRQREKHEAWAHPWLDPEIGTWMMSVVPCPGAVSISRDPPTRDRRSRMPRMPRRMSVQRALHVFPVKALAIVFDDQARLLPVASSIMPTFVASACLTTFVIAS